MSQISDMPTPYVPTCAVRWDGIAVFCVGALFVWKMELLVDYKKKVCAGVEGQMVGQTGSTREKFPKFI